MKFRMSESTEIKGSHCPFCNHYLDGCTGVGEVDEDKPALPKSGDFTVCAVCGEFAIFDKDLVLQKPNIEQMQKLRDNTDLFALLNKIQQAAKYAIANIAFKKMNEIFEEGIDKWRKR